jgi:hypothetical protein
MSERETRKKGKTKRKRDKQKKMKEKRKTTTVISSLHIDQHTHHTEHIYYCRTW